MTADLEVVFGDPRIPGPLGDDAVLADDDARRLSEWGSDALTEWGFGAEFVPASLGGRWGSTEEMVHRLRPVFRRDPALGLGQGITSLMAAVNVWVAGSAEQQAEVAAMLIDGKRISVGFHELAHGNDFLANDFVATIGDSSVVLSGEKNIINNIDRAEAVLFFARSSDAPGPRSHSLVLWEKAPTTRVTTGHRYETVGMRGCLLGGAVIDDLELGLDTLVGEPGSAVGTALRAFQVTRAAIPGLAIGGLDAALRLAVQYSSERALYRTTVAELPHAKSLIADAAADLLMCDAFAMTVVRSLHLAPRNGFLLSAASKYLVPSVLNEAMRTLSTLFGSTFYARVSPYGVFEKLVRDLQVVPIGHAGATTCLLSIIPNLPSWRRRATKPADPIDGLFDLGAPLPELDFNALEIGAGSGDPLSGELTVDAASRISAAGSAHAAELVSTFAGRRANTLTAVEALDPRRLGADAPHSTFAVAREFALLQAAGACVGVWAAAAEGTPNADPRWLCAALQRLDALWTGRRAVLDTDTIDYLVARTVARSEGAVSLGLDERSVTIGTAAAAAGVA